MKTVPFKTAEDLIRRGYRRVSNKYRIVSRIDRPDWREFMAKEHAPWDPQGDGMGWVFLLGRQAGSAEDHYRSVYSKDNIENIPNEIFKQIPGSGYDPVGYVNLTTLQQERHCQVVARLYSKGDYVITPNGVAKVVEDQKVMLTLLDLMSAKIKVEYKHSGHRTEAGVSVDADYDHLIMIDQKDYEEA